MLPHFAFIRTPFLIADNTQSNNLKRKKRKNISEKKKEKVKEWAIDIWNCWYSKYKLTIEKLVNENL